MVTLRDRKLAIVLLDLIGSTRFVDKVGARRAAEWLQYHDRLTRSLLYRFSGREIDRSDGFMLSFERPIDAVNFALHYQRTIPPRIRIECRIGIHWGEVVEVEQDELDVGMGAKRYELEGISKNITARTMSMCCARQVLLTESALNAVRNRTNSQTPKKTRFACVGLYRFKGVKQPQTIYAVGETTESLQPPPSTEKTRRLGGAKRVKSHLRHMRIRELSWWVIVRLAWISALYILITLYPFLSRPHARRLWGIDHAPFTWVDTLNAIARFIATGEY